MYGASSRLCRLGSPVTAFPEDVVSGIAPITSTASPETRIFTIAGSNPGTGNVRRFLPSTLIWPLGPRSVTVQNSPLRPAG